VTPYSQVKQQQKQTQERGTVTPQPVLHLISPASLTTMKSFSKKGIKNAVLTKKDTKTFRVTKFYGLLLPISFSLFKTHSEDRKLLYNSDNLIGTNYKIFLLYF
jgi:hypothetical protein